MFQPIHTQRLVLGCLTPADADAILRYHADPEVSRYQSWGSSSADELRAFIARTDGVEPIRPGEWFQIGIVWAETGELVGDLGLHPRPDERRQVELGVTLAAPFQGRGFASEAIRAILQFLFTQTDTHRVSLSVDPRNSPCIRLLERCGMRQEACMIESLWFKGAWVDDRVFALLRKEWEAGGPCRQPLPTDSPPRTVT
jgi:RimJ/RimL family protein N-acetyltransferase